MLWVSGELPWHVTSSINSFLNHGHPVVLYGYDRPGNLPADCRYADAASILPQELIFVYNKGPTKGYLSGFSNWFRFALLYRCGGWWSDSDVICVKPFESGHSEFIFASEYQPHDPNYVNTNVIYVRAPGAPLMKACVEFCAERGSDVVHGQSGPDLLNRVVREYGYSRHIVANDVYNPVNFADCALFLESPMLLSAISVSRTLRGLRPISLSSRTRGVHLYCSQLTALGARMREPSDIPRGSYLDKLVRTTARGSSAGRRAPDARIAALELS